MLRMQKTLLEVALAQRQVHIYKLGALPEREEVFPRFFFWDAFCSNRRELHDKVCRA